ncbi:hypothetical protein [Desulfoscipio geothermicus]|uniref:Spore germination protein gerPA/gerPF n=1 Tax=Desulfoscipio geothermicus DSM 3669 TaxID=1121426 RepID=A0A1I6DTT3_9FIRM|nr:hypothetical protein [Desulfoscipio geothermicus]SFR08718.1 hypothetical protein SAMN05660706_11742 [Desulfoscipio geothermicus DSM 3669]
MTGMSLQINIHTIRIAEVNTGSAVAIGNNYFIGWQTYNKMNNGFDRLNGDRNVMADASFEVNDPDCQDMICNERQNAPSSRALFD